MKLFDMTIKSVVFFLFFFEKNDYLTLINNDYLLLLRKEPSILLSFFPQVTGYVYLLAGVGVEAQIIHGSGISHGRGCEILYLLRHQMILMR